MDWMRGNSSVVKAKCPMKLVPNIMSRPSVVSGLLPIALPIPAINSKWFHSRKGVGGWRGGGGVRCPAQRNALELAPGCATVSSRAMRARKKHATMIDRLID